ncbi:MAG: hypothetical protein ACFFDW_01400 [Candidatus Thorarchaeota archaeon]
MSLLSDLTSIISLVFLAIGLVFLIVKIIFKLTKKEVEGTFYQKIRKPLYIIHISTPVLATILAFIHGFAFLTPINQTFAITGWILGADMLLLSILGIVMGFKNKWMPFETEQDRKYLVIRIIKWILSLGMIVLVIGHYLF